MDTKLGTAWVAPGEGQAVQDFTDALRAGFGMLCDTPLLTNAWERLIDLGLKHKTNLRLTGLPLTGYDLRRIVVCE